MIKIKKVEYTQKDVWKDHVPQQTVVGKVWNKVLDFPTWIFSTNIERYQTKLVTSGYCKALITGKFKYNTYKKYSNFMNNIIKATTQRMLGFSIIFLVTDIIIRIRYG